MSHIGGSLSVDPARIRRDPIVARVPFFYGWVMLPLALAAQVATIPGQTLGVSLFTPLFESDLVLKSAQVSGAYMLGTLLAAVPQTFFGALMDRQGIRRTMTGVVLLFGLTCAAVSQVSGLATLFLAFLLLRMLGQGALSLTAGNSVAMWFNRRLGRVSGLKSVGLGVAFAIAPKIIQWLIETCGWRWAYVILGGLVWAVMLPLLAVFFRNRPEDVGQCPDGLPGSQADTPRPSPDAGDEHGGASTRQAPSTLGQAFRTRAYWIMAGTNGLWAMVGTAFIFHIVPLSRSQGLTVDDATSVLSAFWMSFAAMQLVGGFLADRLPLNVLLCASMACVTTGLGLLLNVTTAWMSLSSGLLLGGAQGLSAAVGATAWVRYYGRSHLGKIRGSVGTGMVACSSVGPFAMGLARDVFGGYQEVLWVFLCLFAATVPLALWATPPRRPLSPGHGDEGGSPGLSPAG